MRFHSKMRKGQHVGTNFIPCVGEKCSWWASLIWWDLKRNDTNELTYKTERLRLRDWTYGCWRERWGEWIVRQFGMDRYTLLYVKWITNNYLLYSTQCYVAAWRGRGFGGEWIHVYIWLSPFTVHLKLSQHCLLISCVCVRMHTLSHFSRIQLCVTLWTV